MDAGRQRVGIRQAGGVAREQLASVVREHVDPSLNLVFDSSRLLRGENTCVAARTRHMTFFLVINPAPETRARPGQ